MIEGNNNTCRAGRDDIWGKSHPRDLRLQIYISLTLGLGAFLTFCFLRPRWKGLYAARKKQNDLATALPELPDSFFGWIIPLWKITDEQVLASAGLDAYVYLAFFKMAIKFLLVTLFFALAVIKPVHDTHPEGKKSPLPDDPNDHRIQARSTFSTLAAEYEYYTDYLWMYIVFVYLFTGLILYLIVSETRRIIDIRQEYLGSQTTITDRTIRLSGIPIKLRSEDKIKEFIEDLEIGKVESVTLCKNWKELDERVVQRETILRKLEEAWTVHLGSKRVERSLETLPIVQPTPPESEGHDRGNESEASHLLGDVDRDPDYVIPYAQQRPTAKIWYGRWKLRYKNVDAIDYYEEKLHKIDEEIKVLRKKDFEPTPLAFVTMDSVASAQMAIQAVLDPSPLQLLANNSPAPSDVVWSNTYLSRAQRITRSWSITFIIGILSIFWTVLLVPIAGALNTCSIHEVFPGLADALDRHPVLQSLVNTQLPTLALTLINVAVPFLYDWMANKQGMISQGDVELSVISKNFFFTFFNFFILFTLLGTASGLVDMFTRFGKNLNSATQIAYALAKSLSDLLGFYTNFIILQGFGLFPFRLLEFGALSLYPVYLIGAKTPRDYAELVQPPVFSYGFFLPQTILIFIICTVYSVLRDSWQVLLTGLAYFMIGHFVHKYQLLYAMEHRQHSTGRGWTMMCDRVIVGVVLFQITVAGELALKKAFKRAIIVAPLIIGTLWFLFVFSRTYRPLMKFIALRSLRNPEQSDLGRDIQEEAVASGREGRRMRGGRLTVDEARESGLRFANPSLIMPLNDVWILNSSARSQNGSGVHITAQRHRTSNGGAAATSSQIYLSRGVAGTKSEPALPVLDLQPIQRASYFTAPTARKLSLSPYRLSNERMSHILEHPAPTPRVANSRRLSASEQSPVSSNYPEHTPTYPTKRSEVLRHVFPRPSRSRAPQGREVTCRVTKPDHYHIASSSRMQSRPRVAFHRYMTSIFGNSWERNVHASSPQNRSRASSFGSRPGSSNHGSVPSLDLVSPGTFVFSGPSLRSEDSINDSTSRLPSLAASSDIQRLVRNRTDSFSMLDSSSVIDVGILEPVVERGITRTVSDVLLGISTPIEEAESFSLSELEQDAILDDTTCNQNCTALEEKALRLSNRVWYRALAAAAPPIFPASYRLPVEVVQQVYDYLGPKDFNAARHTCRGWMRASLTKSLLSTMLTRGGWLSSAESALHATRHAANHHPSSIPPTREWLLSRHLSRQCALASGWTGNGLDSRPAIVESSQVDFAELCNGYTGSSRRESSNLIFATSVCGRFLCVARDTLIYIYEVQNGLLTPATSVVCPRRVLSMSMDVSSGRHAIAALLEGRMGMVCELCYGRKPGDESPLEVRVENPHRTTTKNASMASHASESKDGLGFAECASPQVPPDLPCVQESDFETFNAINVQSNYQDVSLRGTDDQRTFDRNLINHTWNLNLHGPLTTKFSPSSLRQSIPIESGTSTFYRHLCSEDDPPRSVSICPQRRCVAFGCSAGIELHWIDALTGQSLGRWFPLTAPSDYLYFLSPRPGFESAKKLRLISSAAHPDHRPAIIRRFFSSRPTVSSFWDSFGLESSSRRPTLPSCDHYHAVPLSDGHHVLFIDPSTSKLTLGCDAPLGRPTKLLRKIVFIPPEEKVVPRLYTAAADMSQGCRVLVAYGDTIMLYSIPPDICNLSRLEQKTESWDVYTALPFSTEGRVENHWLSWWDEPFVFDPANRDNSNSIWPIAIRGTEIGQLSGVCELAVQTQPEILMWAFTHSSQCKTWRLHNHADPIVRSKRYICRSGLVHDSYSIDDTGDVIMEDTPPIDLHHEENESETPQAEGSVIVGFDGNASGVVKRIPKALAIENDEWVDLLDVRGASHAWFDRDGDVVICYGS
ncbi:DUF221-domain-containing protein [Cucurbitaria berberidis CBS 394.84]|uniref:DUF221-domain-containing protein n=1 Tax=Cucurbitaria berberidis CBS 394.84 TaxID=1168544 RepID=A0A9P4GGS7_9PLEO|nr:DUF221-domain-containing protein [Cucurbitaria berberidis CBS 394.84]KAF1845818.1 DUF221-domain-containing protein [Cucurbitaria berberidis CBS 394.84]